MLDLNEITVLQACELATIPCTISELSLTHTLPPLILKALGFPGQMSFFYFSFLSEIMHGLRWGDLRFGIFRLQRLCRKDHHDLLLRELRRLENMRLFNVRMERGFCRMDVALYFYYVWGLLALMRVALAQNDKLNILKNQRLIVM